MRAAMASCILLGGLLLLPAAAAASSIITELDSLAIEATMADTPGPPQAARLFAILHTATYEAWQTYDPVASGCLVGQSLDGTGGEPTPGNKTEACAVAGFGVLSWLVPGQQEVLDEFMLGHGFDPQGNSAPAVLGRQVAARVIAEKSGDGSNQLIDYRDTTGYAPRPASVGEAWQPLIVGGVKQSFTAPHWFQVTPFALHDPAEFRPPAPPAAGSPEFEAGVREIIDISAHLTSEQKVTSDYWKMEGEDSRTPPGHLVHLAQGVSAQHGYGIDEDAKLFFVLANTIGDGAIAAWEAKRHHDYVRPITAIRNLGHVPIQAWGGPGLGTTNTYADQFLPYQPVNFVTPPFPEYVSGHSTFTAAWAEILKRWTGSDDYGLTVTENYLPIDNEFIPPVTLHYPTFTSAAEASGLSRLYGGIHWRWGNEQGQVLGRKVAALAWDHAQDCFAGRVAPAGEALALLDAAHWSASSIDGFDPPAFSTTGGLRIAIAFAPGNTFGFWQTAPLDPPVKGQNKLTLALTPTDTGAGKRHPELRVRVLREDNTMSSMCLVAQTSADQAMPSTASVSWESDGMSRFRVAIDLLSFAADQEGGYLVTSVSNRRVMEQ